MFISKNGQRYSAAFNRLPVGTSFARNGNRWIKQSTRTAFLPEYNCWFYFGQHDVCIVDAATAQSIYNAGE
jgi:hypothetical protein